MSALDCFGRRGTLVGADAADAGAVRVSLRSAGVGLAGGLAGVVAWRAHPVLGFFLASAAAGNAAAVAGGEMPQVTGGRRVACVGVATAAALAAPAGFPPAAAWVLGLVAADLLLGGEVAAAAREVEVPSPSSPSPPPLLTDGRT